jgi:ubiquinone biosynthesis protein UbiJ
MRLAGIEEKMRHNAKMLTVAEAGRRGGKARLKKMTPEQRQQVARKGARARARSLTPEQRKESARKAARARWAKQLDKLNQSTERLGEAMKKLARLRGGKNKAAK